MSAHQNKDGRQFLEGLILRAEEILGKMIYKLHHVPFTLEEMLPMINSVSIFVNTWEQPLADVQIEDVLSEAGGVDEERRHQEGLLMEAVAGLGAPPPCLGKPAHAAQRNTIRTAEQETSFPEFECLEQSLKEYVPGHSGIGFITHVPENNTTFFMLDRTKKSDHVTKFLVTLQNVTSQLNKLPTSPRDIFGIGLDGQIFRAVRNRDEAGAGRPFVWLLDTGETLPFKRQPLFELPAYYKSFPPLAIRCELVNAANKSFLGEQSLYINRKFEVCHVDGAVLHVRLGAAPRTAKNGTVSKGVEQPPKEFKVSADKLTQEQRDVLYEEPLSTSNVMKATMGYVPQDDRKICKFYDPATQGCFKGAACKLLHVAKDPHGWTRDQALHKVQIRAQLSEPPRGATVHMIPTTVVSVEEFYAHLDEQENSRELARLQELLNQPDRVQSFRKMDHKPYARELVFARYAEDDQWYRAEVLDYFHDGLVHVIYLDFGNHEHVTLDDLRLWDDGFDWLPFQAILCRVGNVSKRRDDDHEATVALREAIFDKRIAVKVLDIRAYWEVLVYNDCEVDIGQFLVDGQMALPRSPIVITDRNALIPA